jgi:hypothetical protein
MSGAPNGYLDCPECGGAGVQIRIDMDCCGRINDLGYCASHCAIPAEVLEACPVCSGGGKVPRAGEQ